jgi:hypothetical protein
MLNTPDNTWDVTVTDMDSGITGTGYVAVTEGPTPSPSPNRVHRSQVSSVQAALDQTAVTRLFAASPSQPCAWIWASQVEALVWSQRRPTAGLVDAGTGNFG